MYRGVVFLPTREQKLYLLPKEMQLTRKYDSSFKNTAAISNEYFFTSSPLHSNRRNLE
jgi:hypothetical protein